MEFSRSVSVSGYVMSSLLYEHSSSDSDQEGFLIGDVITKLTESISDNQISLKKEVTIINIYSHVPCDDVYSFYEFNGDIQLDKLQLYLKDKIEDVVGWYRFRRHTPLVASLREKSVHKKLSDMLPHGRSFLLGLFTSFVSENMATHTFDHVFLTRNLFRESLFEPITLNIINLEDTTHDEYRTFPRAPVNTKSGSYYEVAASVRGEDQVQESVLLAEDINTVLLDKIEGLVEQVSSSEAEIGFLALDIEELEEKITKHLPKTESPTQVLPIQDMLLSSKSEQDRTFAMHAMAACKYAALAETELGGSSRHYDNTACSTPTEFDYNCDTPSPTDEYGSARTRNFSKTVYTYEKDLNQKDY